jgi:hypothetical protein
MSLPDSCANPWNNSSFTRPTREEMGRNLPAQGAECVTPISKASNWPSARTFSSLRSGRSLRSPAALCRGRSPFRESTGCGFLRRYNSFSY